MAMLITKKADKILRDAKLQRVNGPEHAGHFCYCTGEELKKYSNPSEQCEFNKDGYSSEYQKIRDKLIMKYPGECPIAVCDYLVKFKFDRLVMEKREYDQLSKAKDEKFVETLLDGKEIRIENVPYFSRYYKRT